MYIVSESSAKADKSCTHTISAARLTARSRRSWDGRTSRIAAAAAAAIAAVGLGTTVTFCCGVDAFMSTYLRPALGRLATCRSEVPAGRCDWARVSPSRRWQHRRQQWPRRDDRDKFSGLRRNGTPDSSADNNPNDADSENDDTNGDRPGQGSDADSAGDEKRGRERGIDGDGITSAGGDNVVGETKGGDSKDDDGFEITDEQLSALYGRISALRKRDVALDRVCARNWRQGTCRHDLLFQATDPIQHVACEGDQLAFGTDGGGTWVISRTTGYVVNVFEGHLSDVTALFFDGEFVISGGSDKTVRVQRNARNSLQNEELGECVHVLSGHTERVTGVTRLGRDRVASSSVDSTLRVWSLETGKVLHELLLPAPVYCLEAVDGYLVTGMMDGSVLAWQARDEEAPPRQVLKIEAHKGAVSALAFPAKDVLVTGGGDGAVKFWDLQNGGVAVDNFFEVDGQNITHVFKGHNAPVCAVKCNEHRIVSAGADGTVSAWDLRSGKELFQICGHKERIRSLQFDREYLITDGTGENLFLHDFTGKRGIPPMIGGSDPTDQPPSGKPDGGPFPGWGGGGLFGMFGGDGPGSGNGLVDFSDGDEPGYEKPR